MRTLNIVTQILLIVGGLNWLLVGLFQFDLVAGLFGGQTAALSRVVYVLVGLSALWQATRLPALLDTSHTDASHPTTTATRRPGDLL